MTTSIDGDGLAGLTLRRRTPVSGRARAAELPPGLQKYLLLRQHHEQFDHSRAGHQHR
jgi:hypothetical protein